MIDQRALSQGPTEGIVTKASTRPLARLVVIASRRHREPATRTLVRRTQTELTVPNFRFPAPASNTITVFQSDCRHVV